MTDLFRGMWHTFIERLKQLCLCGFSHLQHYNSASEKYKIYRSGIVRSRKELDITQILNQLRIIDLMSQTFLGRHHRSLVGYFKHSVLFPDSERLDEFLIEKFKHPNLISQGAIEENIAKTVS